MIGGAVSASRSLRAPRGPPAAEPGEGHLTPALIGGGDEDQPEHAAEQQRELGHQERDDDADLRASGRDLCGDAGDARGDVDRLGGVGAARSLPIGKVVNAVIVAARGAIESASRASGRRGRSRPW
jgi:hypothetical protein